MCLPSKTNGFFFSLQDIEYYNVSTYLNQELDEGSIALCL